MTHPFDLTGKVAVVTGSSKGIGRATVEMMADLGAKVVVSSRKAPICEEVVAGINQKHGDERAISVPCNIAEKAQLQNLVDQTREKWGQIDILVCNAAVNPFFGSAADIPDDAFDKIMACNIRSNHWLCNMVLPEMIERKDGAVVIVSSVGGLKGSEMIGPYCISKAADMQMVRNLSSEYGRHNVRINCLAPGLIRTHFARALWENPDILKASTSTTPMRRIGEPDEIAGGIVFLSSQAAGFTNGHTLVIDGGATIS
ncbi:MAG: SDR family NAD(P)-dependent oxidoreductase [Gammaproteobacteria bacterium]